MPLEASRVARLREVVRKDLSAMSNEVFVNATLAFMAKAAEDKKTEAIEVLQRILQVWRSWLANFERFSGFKRSSLMPLKEFYFFYVKVIPIA